MSTTQTHQHESQHRERGHEEQKLRHDEKDGSRHGHDHHHRHHPRQWFNVNAEQRDIIIMILGGVIALVFVLLFVF